MPRLLVIATASIVACLSLGAGLARAHDPAPARQDLAQSQGHDPMNCYCLAQGKSFAVGETACLRTAEGPRIAECGMVLNNTSWQFTAKPCPES
jgi:hypothetical protein